MKQTLKAPAAFIGVAAAGALAFAALYFLMWGAFYAGIPM